MSKYLFSLFFISVFVSSLATFGSAAENEDADLELAYKNYEHKTWSSRHASPFERYHGVAQSLEFDFLSWDDIDVLNSISDHDSDESIRVLARAILETERIPRGVQESFLSGLRIKMEPPLAPERRGEFERRFDEIADHYGQSFWVKKEWLHESHSKDIHHVDWIKTWVAAAAAIGLQYSPLNAERRNFLEFYAQSLPGEDSQSNMGTFDLRFRQYVVNRVLEEQLRRSKRAVPWTQTRPLRGVEASRGEAILAMARSSLADFYSQKSREMSQKIAMGGTAVIRSTSCPATLSLNEAPRSIH